MEQNILSKIIANAKGYLLVLCAVIFGAITAPYTILVPFVFCIMYPCAYIYGAANNHKKPQYFFICLSFLIANNMASGVRDVPAIILWGLIIICALLIIQFIVLCIKRVPFRQTDKSLQRVKPKYIGFIKENPAIIKKASVHSLILFIVSWVAYFLYDHRGYWMIISSAAILIGNEYAKIIVRGKRRMLGALIGLIVLCGLVFFNANPIVLIIVAIAAMVGATICMPKKYILGCAFVSIHATVSKIIASGDLSYTIALQRVLWTVTGACITMALCKVADKLFPTLYSNHTKEKLIAKY